MSYSLDNVRVLIVDDMKPMLTLTHSVLSAFGFKKVQTAQNTEQGWDLLKRNDPDIVLTDWLMEPEDGLAFARKIRKNPESPNPYVPIVMMTGFSSRLRVENARDSGITEFLVKPFAARDLYERIVQIVEKPRQFVDSGQFFGPDRRRRKDDDYDGPKRRATDPDKGSKGNSEPERYAVDILRKMQEDARKV